MSVKVGEIIAFNNLDGVKDTHRVASVNAEEGTIKFSTPRGMSRRRKTQ